jgi:hypothetical protein
MSASLRTRDGSISVAGAILAGEKAASRYVPIDTGGALARARENKVDVKRIKQIKARVDRINARRAVRPG